MNLYCGIGGNRKLWTPKGNEHEITAVEINPEIAKIYQNFFPQDKVIVADAHQFLLEHYKEFDFIWSSPPCQSHSMCNHFLKGQSIIRYPDMKLYEEIILLQTHAKRKWVVENVKSYYKPLIKPYRVQRHYFWSNFFIQDKQGFEKDDIRNREQLTIIEKSEKYGFDITQYKNVDKTKILNNCVNSELGLYIFRCAFKMKQNTMGDFLSPKGESLIIAKSDKSSTEDLPSPETAVFGES